MSTATITIKCASCGKDLGPDVDGLGPKGSESVGKDNKGVQRWQCSACAVADADYGDED